MDSTPFLSSSGRKVFVFCFPDRFRHLFSPPNRFSMVVRPVHLALRTGFPRYRLAGGLSLFHWAWIRHFRPSPPPLSRGDVFRVCYSGGSLVDFFFFFESAVQLCRGPGFPLAAKVSEAPPLGGRRTFRHRLLSSPPFFFEKRLMCLPH